MTFVIGAPQVRVFLKKTALADWVASVQERSNWISAQFNPTINFVKFTEAYYLNQVGMSAVGAGIEAVTFPGLPHPALVGEFEASFAEWNINFTLHKSQLIDDLIYSFSPSDYPPYLWEAVLVFSTGGGIHLQNCIPRNMSIQFNEATNLPTFSVAFLSNFVVFFPPGTFTNIPTPTPPTLIVPKVYSSILTLTGDSLWGLKVQTLTLNVTNNIQGHFTLHWQEEEENPQALRALKMFSVGYQTGELSLRVIVPPQTKQSFQQTPTPIREIQLTMLDDTFSTVLGTFDFLGRFTGVRWDVNPSGGLVLDLNTILGGSVYWQYQG